MRAERVRAEDLEVTMVEYGSATIVTFDATHEGSVLEITSLGGDERRAATACRAAPDDGRISRRR